MSNKLILSPAFIDDTKTIFEYTEKTWGLKQAEIYHSNIERALNQIANNPYLGKSRIDISEKHRSFLVGLHILIYYVQDGNVHISRIIHHSRDYKKYDIPH